MDADERLLALKKAYADILLNTSKEAAAKIMVSERKALRFQHEMTVAKEEALQMMLRLKKMMDSKISEAEKTSRIQQGKIEELEAQLQEAEDIVNDLREELRHVQAKLERVTNNKVRYLDEHDITTPEEAFEEERQYTSQSIIYPLPESQDDSPADSNINNLCLNQSIEHPECYNALIHLRNFYGAKPDLPSIISRTKEHEFYRNGCTQRIRACERNLLDSELSLSRGPNDVNCKRNVKGDEEDKSVCPVPTDEVYNMCNIQKKEAVLEDSSCYQVQVKSSLCRKRNRATRHRKNRSPTCKLLPDQFKKIIQAPEISCSNASPTLVKNSAQPEADPTIIAPKLSSDIIDIGMQPECAETTESSTAYVKDYDVENMIMKSEALINISVPMGQEGGSTEQSVVQVSKTNPEKINEPIVHSVSKTSDTTNEVPSQPGNHRVIKYTFQRKRKRDTLNISDGNVSSENSTLKRKTVEKHNDTAEPDKSCLVTESSRESRRLAQVARQLISLSEKKWHK